jgi:hypothetical protein
LPGGVDARGEQRSPQRANTGFGGDDWSIGRKNGRVIAVEGNGRVDIFRGGGFGPLRVGVAKSCLIGGTGIGCRLGAGE